MSPDSFLITLFITICSVLSMKKKRAKRTDKIKLPPGPRKLPIIGNLHQLGKLPHRSLRHLSKKHGDLMLLQLGFVPTLVVSSADRAREIFKSHDLAFSGRPSLYASRKFSYDLASISFAPYGEYWREIRKVLVLELMTAKRVQSFGSIRVDEVSRLMDRIARCRILSIWAHWCFCFRTTLCVVLLLGATGLKAAAVNSRRFYARRSIWWGSSIWPIIFQEWIGLTDSTGWTGAWQNFPGSGPGLGQGNPGTSWSYEAEIRRGGYNWCIARNSEG